MRIIKWRMRNLHYDILCSRFNVNFCFVSNRSVTYKEEKIRAFNLKRVLLFIIMFYKPQSNLVVLTMMMEMHFGEVLKF